MKFKAEIYKIGINPVVDPPGDVLDVIFEQAGKSKGPIPVRGKLGDTAFIQTLVKYQGAWRLYVNGPMLRDSGLEVGDTASVDLEFDPERREVPVPPALEAALRKNAKAKAAFDKLPPSRRKEIFRYIASLRSATAIERNVARVLEQLSRSHSVSKRRR